MVCSVDPFTKPFRRSPKWNPGFGRLTRGTRFDGDLLLTWCISAGRRKLTGAAALMHTSPIPNPCLDEPQRTFQRKDVATGIRICVGYRYLIEFSTRGGVKRRATDVNNTLTLQPCSCRRRSPAPPVKSGTLLFCEF